MKKRTVSLLLAGILLLGLTACGPETAGTPTATPTPVPTVTPTPTPKPTLTPPKCFEYSTPSPIPWMVPPSMSEPFAVQEADVPPGEYEPWKEAYADLLRKLRQNTRKVMHEITASLHEFTVFYDTDIDGVADLYLFGGSSYYSLYDVNKDGVPELFIQYFGRWGGNAVGKTICYTFQNGEIMVAGELPRASSPHSCPKENAVLFRESGSTCEYYRTYSLLKGVLLLQDEFEIRYTSGSDGDPAEAILPGDIVSNSKGISSYLSDDDIRPDEHPALLLPVYEYGAPTRKNPSPAEDAEVRSAIGTVLWEGGKLFGVSGEGFYGDTGFVTLDEYLQPGVAYPYNDVPLSVTQYAWADVNTDGQIDCILLLEEPPNTYGYVNQLYVILSMEDDRVYAYFFGVLEHPTIAPDGSVYLQHFGDRVQISFYKNQCYYFSVTPPLEADALIWEPFPSETVPVPESTPAPTPTPAPFEVQEANVPPGDFQPWREAYAQLIQTQHRELAELGYQYIHSSPSERLRFYNMPYDADKDGIPELELDIPNETDRYRLYDIDKDGVPELFVQYGDHSGTKRVLVFTFQNGVPVCVGQPSSEKFYYEDFSLYSWPEENAVLLYWGGPDAPGYYEKYSLVDGTLVFQEKFSCEYVWESETVLTESPHANEIVPDSEYISQYRSIHSSTSAVLLPIYDYGSQPHQAPVPMEEAEVRATIGRVLWEDEAIYVAPYIDGGFDRLNYYLWSLTTPQYTWADVNGDGQTDCIFHVKDDFYILLDYQDNKVYAYRLYYINDFVVTADGSVYIQYLTDRWMKTSFYKNQCYSYRVSPPAEYDGLAWEPFPAEKP